MRVYGLEFKIKVIESLEALNSEEVKEYTLTEITNVFLSDTVPKPNKRYTTTLKDRIRRCLVEWSEFGRCEIERRQHPKNNYIVLYYSFKKAA